MSQRVLVTAGAAGIGRVIAERFLQNGARVAVCDVDPAAVQEFQAAHPDTIAVVADVVVVVGVVIHAIAVAVGGCGGCRRLVRHTHTWQI